MIPEIPALTGREADVVVAGDMDIPILANHYFERGFCIVDGCWWQRPWPGLMAACSWRRSSIFGYITLVKLLKFLAYLKIQQFRPNWLVLKGDAMTTMSRETRELLDRIAQVSKEFANDTLLSAPRQVIFRAIHEIAQEINEDTRHYGECLGYVESMFCSACRQLRGITCDCRSTGIHRCPLLSQTAS